MRYNSDRSEQKKRDVQSTIEARRRQRQLHLGSQLIASAIDPDTHARLQLDHDRLAAENANLQRRLAEKEGLTADFREDLAASRQAHADDIARLTAETASPVAAIRHQRPNRDDRRHD